MKIFTITILGGLLFILSGCSPSLEEDSAALRKVFDDYRQAIASKRVDDAAALFSIRSLDSLEKIRELALYATPAELEQRELVEQMLTLVLRVNSDGVNIDTLPPQKLLALLIESGLVGAELDSKSKLDAIVIEGDQATANHIKYTRPVREGMRFVRDPEGWRQDLKPVLERMNTDIGQLGKRKKTKRIRVHFLVEFVTGQPLKSTHFEPLASRTVNQQI